MSTVPPRGPERQSMEPHSNIASPSILFNDCAMALSAAIRDDCRVPPVVVQDCAAPPLQDCSPPYLIAPSPDAGASITTLRPHPLLRTLSLDDEHIAAFVPSLSRVVVLNHSAQVLLGRLPLEGEALDHQTAVFLQNLYECRLLTNGGADIPPPPEPEVLVAWLHLTNACNLCCSYCYLAKSGESMSATTARAGIDAVIRSARLHGFRTIALKYAGGEATLRMDLVEATHTYAQEQARRHCLALHAGILSNGTVLTPRKLVTIRRLGLSLMISVDGSGADHNTNRLTASGVDSARAALAGVEMALEAGLTPAIAITVSATNIGGLPALLEWLLERGLPFSISFYREKASGGSVEQLQIEKQDLIEGMRRAYAVIARRPPRWSLLGTLLDRADLSYAHSRSCAAGHNYLVVDHHGRIASCQMAMDRPVTDVSAADPLSSLRLNSAGIHNMTVDEKEGCRTCDWRYWCAGGCPITTLRATGCSDMRSPNCAVYTSLYPDVIRLEGLRLLYWQRQAP